MAQARKIEGTAEELIAFLEKRRHRTNLTLLLPAEPTGKQTVHAIPKERPSAMAFPCFLQKAEPNS